MPEPNPEQFRRAVSRYATGIAIVTTVTDGVDHAMTANSFTSVSLDPLLALVAAQPGLEVPADPAVVAHEDHDRPLPQAGVGDGLQQPSDVLVNARDHAVDARLRQR